MSRFIEACDKIKNTKKIKADGPTDPKRIGFYGTKQNILDEMPTLEKIFGEKAELRQISKSNYEVFFDVELISLEEYLSKLEIYADGQKG